MKIIHSEGGPLVGLSHRAMQSWGGIANNRFVGEASKFVSDYEAAGSVTASSGKPPVEVGKLSGQTGDAVLISMPLSTAVIAADSSSAYIAQVQYADSSWSFVQVKLQDFENVLFDESTSFYFEGGSFVFFDAAYPGTDVGDDYIDFTLAAGSYVLASGVLQPDDETMLLLYCIKRVA